MRTLALRFSVAVLACLLGVGTSIVFSNIRSAHSESGRDDFVTVGLGHNLPESWPEAPVRLVVTGVQRSYDLSEVDITFNVSSLNGKSIASFEVWAVKSGDKIVYQHKRILVHSMREDHTGLSVAPKEYTETVSVSLDRGFFSKRTDHIQLYLGSVEFSDGTRWLLPPSM